MAVTARIKAWARAAALRALGVAVAAYVHLVDKTTRWRWEGREHLDAVDRRGAFVGATWHGRLLMTATLRPRGRRAVALISASRDGDPLEAAMRALGANAVRGSSRDPRKPDKVKGGVAATAQLAAALNNGDIVVITPDGPRGPLMRAKPGVAAIAAAAQAPVLPAAYAASRAWTLRTWDRFTLPAPFGRGAWVIGAPIPPADPEDREAVEAARAAIEVALIDVTRRADALVGRTPLEPGPEIAPSREPAREAQAQPAAWSAEARRDGGERAQAGGEGARAAGDGSAGARTG